MLWYLPAPVPAPDAFSFQRLFLQKGWEDSGFPTDLSVEARQHRLRIHTMAESAAWP